MKVLVTGATGFLGPYVCTAIQQAGWQVRAAVRGPSNSVLADESVVIDTPGERAGWAEAVRGIDAVVHLAARAHRSPAAQRAERELYELVNVTNTVNLATAALDAGARHFIYLSSIAVNGASTDGRPPFTESDTPAPATVYAATKLDAEKNLERIAGSGPLKVTRIRPPLIYGRNARGSLALLVKALRLRVPLPLGAIRNRRAFAAAENVASFAVHALRTGVEGTYIVADDEQVATPAFIRSLAAAMNLDTPMFSVPAGALQMAFRVSGQGELAHRLIGNLEVDTRKARATGWSPPLTQAQALARAAGLRLPA